MTTHRRTATTSWGTLALTASLAACGTDSTPTTVGDDAHKGPGAEQQVAAVAKDYMRAWLIVSPSDSTRMCELQTKAARPNFDDDGGTLKGCITTYKDYFSDPDDDSGRAPLTVTIDHVQDVVASAQHPAGKGALATMHRTGEKPFRYALRLIKEDGRWRVEQTADVSDDHRHTDDPVAAVLENLG